MYSTKKKIFLTTAGFLLVFGGFAYHVYAFENLSQEIDEANQTIDSLEQEQINYTVENKAVSEELERLENEYRQSQEELEKTNEMLEEKEKKLEEKDGEIEQLNEDLQAKLEYEANLAQAKLEEEEALAKLEQEKIESKEAEESEVAQEESSSSENVQGDKSTVLSEKEEAKTEQSNGNEVKTSGSNSKTRTLGTFTVTFYAIGDGLTPSTVTANGTDVSSTIYSPEGYRIIAVDTSVIPMNTIVRVTLNGETFLAKSSDTGSAIKGNKIDLLVSSPEEALSRGVQTATIEIIE